MCREVEIVENGMVDDFKLYDRLEFVFEGIVVMDGKKDVKGMCSIVRQGDRERVGVWDKLTEKVQNFKELREAGRMICR